MSFITKLSLVFIIALTSISYSFAQSGKTTRAITNIAGDLYRFQNNFHYSVFLVTEEGVIVTDPINADAAKWLKGEIKKRFNKPIKYLVLSHDHADHSAGGEIFAEAGATVVSHKYAKEVIIGEKRPTAIPDLTFDKQMTLSLGGKTVELIYPGKGHSNNSIVMLFKDARTLFVVDSITVNRLPYQGLSDAYFPNWIDYIRKVERLDFDILAPGHGAIGVKDDARKHGDYLQAVYDSVLAGVRQGKPLDELKRSIRLSAYENWGQYDPWLPLNIEGIYKNISLHRRGN